MKNILRMMFLAVLIFYAVTVDAQLAAGFKGGVNYSGFSNHTGGKRISGHGGIFIHTALDKKLHLQPELLYSSEGQRYTISEAEQNTERTVSVNFVSLPVMFQYFVTPAFFTEAGPQLSFITSAKDKGPGNEKLNVKRSIANTGFSLNIGMGLMTGKKAAVYVRYCFGLTDLTRFDNNADYSRVLQAGFSYRLK
jgi:hypothetical protein